MQYVDAQSLCKLTVASPDVAYSLAQCIIDKHVHVPFRVSFCVFISAQHAIGEGVYDLLRQFSFATQLSRTCRSCGKHTQRKVFGTALCEECTRNPNMRWWMVPLDRFSLAANVRRHRGRRGVLVFADELASRTKLTRKQIRRRMGLR